MSYFCIVVKLLCRQYVSNDNFFIVIYIETINIACRHITFNFYNVKNKNLEKMDISVRIA